MLVWSATIFRFLKFIHIFPNIFNYGFAARYKMFQQPGIV